VRIREGRDGGRPDVAAFYEANYERLVPLLFAVTANLADAEDVVQEAFARACVRWRRLHAYDSGTAQGWPGDRTPRRPGLRGMTGDGRVRGGAAVVRWLLAAATALAVVALAGCNADHGQRTSGVPPTASGPPATGRPAQHAYYAQAADFTGPDAWQEAQRQAQQLRAKRFPATVYSSHTEFPSHTLYFFVAVASGEFLTREQAQAQVERLRRAGFADAEVFEISLPK
jgi:hypothetical protein